MNALPALTDPQVLATLAILVLATFFFARGRISIALVSAGLLVALMATYQIIPVIDPDSGENLLHPTQLLLGFANPALATVIALLVVGEGVSRTGALAILAQWIQKIAVGNWRMAMALSLTVVAISSAFLNNAPIVVIFLPILVTVAKEMSISPSKLLMPLSFASILGGSCTLIGSSTNILVADFANKSQVMQVEMFTFSSLGLVILVVGLIYLIFIAPRLLPDIDNTGQGERDAPFLVQMEILVNSPLVGQRPNDLSNELFKNVEVHRVIRGNRNFVGVFRNVSLKEGDTLVMTGAMRDLKKLEWDARGNLIPGLPGTPPPDPKEQKNQMLAEVVITPNSPFVGQTLSDIRFRENFGGPAVIGLQRFRQRVYRRITQIPLRGGDLLMIHGEEKAIKNLMDRSEFILFSGAQETIGNPQKARVALGILLGIITLAVTPLSNMLILSFMGAFAMLASGCLRLEQGYRAVPPELILLIGSTLALGNAMELTGTAHVLAHELVQITAGGSPWMVLSLFMMLVMIFTNIISNNATAILFAPIAVGAANMLNVSAVPFLMAVIFGANAAFASPIGYKTNLLVLKAGGYSFADFFRTGLPLNLLSWLLASLLIPWFWPL
ncbi:MAG: SLC13 family permease [Magnetococcales bacterium]|nr:SLC13 family permease [Magnetococcales bacterium]